MTKHLISIFCIVFLLPLSVAQTHELTDELYQKAEEYREQNDFAKAAEFYEKAALNEMQLEAPRLEDVYMLLANSSYFYYQIQDFDSALDNCEASLIICEKVYGKENKEYAISLVNFVTFLLEKRNYEHIINISEESKSIILRHLGENSEGYAMFLNTIARSYHLSLQYQKAISTYNDLLEVIARNKGKTHYSYGLYLNNLAQIYSDIYQYDEAISLNMQAIEVAKINHSEYPDFYSLFLKNISIIFSQKEDFPTALNYLEKEREYISKNIGKDKLSYAEVTSGLAINYRFSEDFKKSEQLFLEAKSLYEKNPETSIENYAIFLCELGELYRIKGEPEKALDYAKQGVEYLKNHKGDQDIEYAVRLSNLSLIYESLGHFDQAIFAVGQVLPIVEKHYGVEHSQYISVLGGLAILYQKVKQYDKALILYKEILKHAQSIGTETSDYLVAVNNLGYLYQEIGMLDEAESYFDEALKVARKIYPENHSNLARQLSNLCLVYQLQGKYESALPLQIQSVEITKNSLGNKHESYAKYANNLAITYLRLEDYKKAIPLQQEVIQIFKEANRSHSEMTNYYSNLALMHFGNKEYEKSLEAHLQSMNLLNAYIQQAFGILSETEKEKFISSNQYNFNLIQSHYTFLKDYKKEVDFGSAYDLELTIKSLILSSSQQMRETVLRSNHPEMLALYNKWIEDKNILAKEYVLPEAERSSDLYTLEINAETSEKILIIYAKNIKEPEVIGKTTWKDIQNHLKENEVAIEFSSFDYYDGKQWTDTIVYNALVLRKHDKQPQLVRLFLQSELDEILSISGDDQTLVSQIYRGSIVKSVKQDFAKIYDLIWKPLEEYLSEGQTIYFAPSGTLHQIAFSAIKNKEGKYLSDVYHLKQVSTTAKILENQNQKSYKNIALFGGIDYEQGEWSYLNGTLAEVENIKSKAEKSNLKVIYQTGKTASEESFKSLNGKNSPDILHVASHGFFYPDPKKNLNENQFLIAQENVFQSSDNPLTRSGLLFSGANHFWNHSKPNRTSEDGILTAYEVSNISLLNTELVVLSACETGLGDVKGSEGVFGLQRAFKSAGANYLLMSLWKVPDKETAEFMEEFYKNLFENKDIEQSFTKTQNHMKQKYPDNPYSWAAFVLVR
ncbi:MAG: CHAT domain-containing protein [Weeksellaceae bacterium]|nr:CHAT domain-containing protein [Weeksellaceae bacterium]